MVHHVLQSASKRHQSFRASSFDLVAAGELSLSKSRWRHGHQEDGWRSTRGLILDERMENPTLVVLTDRTWKRTLCAVSREGSATVGVYPGHAGVRRAVGTSGQSARKSALVSSDMAIPAIPERGPNRRTRDLTIAVDALESIAYRRRPVPPTPEGEGGPAQPPTTNH
jgi:hypothetical protein